jgi:hypothetical protein
MVVLVLLAVQVVVVVAVLAQAVQVTHQTQAHHKATTVEVQKAVAVAQAR